MTQANVRREGWFLSSVKSNTGLLRHLRQAEWRWNLPTGRWWTLSAVLTGYSVTPAGRHVNPPGALAPESVSAKLTENWIAAEVDSWLEKGQRSWQQQSPSFRLTS